MHRSLFMKISVLMKCVSLLAFLFFFCFSQVFASDIKIDWSESDGKLSFSQASYAAEYNHLPIYSFQVKGKWKAPILNNPVFLGADAKLFKEDQLLALQSEFLVKSFQGVQKGQWLTTIVIVPVRKSGSNIEILTEANVKLEPDNALVKTQSSNFRKTDVTTSVLSSGDWFKIGVPNTGIYKLDIAFLEQLGMNVNSINPSTIKIYGQQGGMLPELAGAERIQDLAEIPLKVVSASSSSFQKGDYILVYLQGPESWVYDNAKGMFKQQKHLYSDFKGYFITSGGGAGLRVNSLPLINESATKTINTFDDYKFVEDDINNISKSGKLWLGNEFAVDAQFSTTFNFKNILSSQPAKVWIGLAGKSTNNTSTFELKGNGNTLSSIFTSRVGSSDIADFARYGEGIINIPNPGNDIAVQVIYKRPDFDAKAWMDFITINVKRSLKYENEPQIFRSRESVQSGAISNFTIEGLNANVEVWDVTDMFSQGKVVLSGNSFKARTDILRQFAMVENSGSTPQALGKVNNQNLHGLNPAEYIIVTRKAFKSLAEELGRFHQEKDGYSYIVADLEEIFNEFSSGNNDMSAVRDFTKMLYDRALLNGGDVPKFLLLFGDGTFDNKRLGEYLLPSYQSAFSLENIRTYVTDDYFGLLDDSEGANVTNTATELMDIAVGRFVADNLEKGVISVNKVKRYYNSRGDWRNQVTFVADDEDNITHIKDANEVADIIQNQYPRYNVEKIYLDAYRQMSGAGGSRYPDVNTAIANKLFTGTFLWSYAGHGGTNGLAEERILTYDDINSWKNADKLPVFCTATCEFTRFDEEGRTTAGERVFLKEDGGAIAMVTTTRLVYAFENRITNENFTKELMKAAQNRSTSLGEVVRLSKIQSNTEENNRKFSLIGDPALSLAFPEFDVSTTALNVNAQPGSNDTIKALSKVELKGQVETAGVVKSDFNGEVSVIIFDKMSNITTLRNDSKSGSYTFKAAKNTIYKGRARVINGQFTTTFIVPKDINYTIGAGKISYYAENGLTDAAGFDQNIIIGGVSDSIPNDKNGPDVDVFIDDESFVFGGTAAVNSSLLVKLMDESGINTSGSGLGHDITAILDEDSQNPIILNAFYESELDNFTLGKVVYPFSKLEKGRHTLRVKAWDVLNNSGEGYTEFIVEEDAELALYFVLNYPNPFTTNTNFSFEHNRLGDFLDVRIEIFTASGKVVKTIQQMVDANTRRISNLNWDGKDEFGDQLARGVYIYRVTVKDSQGNKTSKYQKLVLLK